jgi:hypothetical protein
MRSFIAALTLTVVLPLAAVAKDRRVLPLTDTPEGEAKDLTVKKSKTLD